jgi:uncharacterized membrane protein YgcG
MSSTHRTHRCSSSTIGSSRRARAALVGSSALLSFLAALWTADARAEVLFQNTGNTQGWGSVFTQKAGTVTEVSSPVYKGTTAVKATQTYQKSDGLNYHSEMIKRMAHLAGQDLYYGHAIYLPPDWVFHNQNVTFQQWAPENPEAPWILMYLQNDHVRLGGRGAMGDKEVGTITGLRGTWIRVVTRIHMANPGLFEVWINDKKLFSQKGNFRAMGPSMRWSNGIYCTRWDTETPTGPRELSIWHDNLRIATTFEEADPASWGDGDSPPPADAGVAADALTEDAEPVLPADAAEPPAVVDAGSAASGGRSGAGGAGTSRGGSSGSSSGSGGKPGSGGSDEGEDPGTSATASSSGCALAGRPGGSGGASLPVAVGVVLALLRRRARPA